MPTGWARRSAGGAPEERSLPPNYTEIKSILDEEVSPGQFVNVVGVVKDCRLPMPTAKTDFKSTLTLCDLSTQDESYGISLVIFRPEADMPQVALGDIVLLTHVKVQRFRSDPLSLITHFSTSLRVYTASKIPVPPKSALVASAPGLKGDKHTPTTEENDYVSYLHRNLDRDALPDEAEFQLRATQSLNIKQKFSLLKDVKDGRFYDLIVRVARDPFVGVELATLYVSDYTENPDFHPQVWEGLVDSTPGGGDPYGYTSGSAVPPKKEWDGPYGKMSIQISCFEPHATYVREEVRSGQWVALRNVQIKYGRDGRFLEGFLRGERNDDPGRVNVHGLDTDFADRETVDPNLKEAIRRQRDYEKKKKQQLKDIKSAQAAGVKRKASVLAEQPKGQPNTRARRKARRAEKRAAAQNQEREEKEEKEQERNEEEEDENEPDTDSHLALNSNIACESHNVPYSTLGSILKPPTYQPVPILPFVCAKYKTRVHVVDFFPPSLEDFACARKRSEYDILSDNDDDSSSEEEEAPSRSDNRIWEWRFALQLEDAAPPSKPNKSSPPNRLWVLLNNTEAQCLTGLDATNLREDEETLSRLRERMFILWGNLEELKTQAVEREKEKGEPAAKKKRGRPRLEKPPLESSPPEDEHGDGGLRKQVSNKPFECCIRQYGVHEGDEDEGKWTRCFGLFGTRICG